MSAKIHQGLIETASSISGDLVESIRRTGPVRLVKRNDLTLAERLCRAVAGQQLSVKAASTIWDRVVESAGTCSLTRHLASAKPESLRVCGLSGAKTRAVQAIAELDTAGGLEAAEFAALNHAERTERLTAIWGVGQWTADMISIFYFGELDIWPDGDGAARGTLAWLTSRRRKTVKTAALFAPHRSYLAIYMWRHLDARPV